MNAKKVLSSISENQDLWVAQYRQEIMERDYNSGLSAAENRGLERGRKEGMSKGLTVGEARGEKRGRNEAKLEAARNMLSMKKLELEEISACTGLPLETVKQLSRNI